MVEFLIPILNIIFFYFRIMVCLRRNKLRKDLRFRIPRILNLHATKWKKFWQKCMKPNNLVANPQRSCLNWKLISWCTSWLWKNSTGTVNQNLKTLSENYLFCSATKVGLIVFFFSFWLKSPKKCAQNYPEHLLFTLLVINVGLRLLIFWIFPGEFRQSLVIFGQFHYSKSYLLYFLI